MDKDVHCKICGPWHDKIKDKPPLLSDEEINLIEGEWYHTPKHKRVRPEILIAEAQRELDIKHYEG